MVRLVFVVTKELATRALELRDTLLGRFVYKLSDQSLDLDEVIERDKSVATNCNCTELRDCSFILAFHIVVNNS